ncbi:hypothetical protein DEU56DRAFT_908529 [Suillus clintonianus]|uniref:uncharacterized protein n=1 Tax=Suillus clintonianus TaxID=1904413 RepID=UPI001B87C28B|nr:uncharacterized protein DEU56DRAFT_908529 [Suillus clintonianus]KAG2150891.1 hypothetical protein DEU56DRAFT_908529 [Suillus clintonianus]
MGPERTKYCDLCQQDIKPRGYTTHRKACEKRAEKQRQNQDFVDSIRGRTVGPSNPQQITVTGPGDRTDTASRPGGQRNISPGAWNDLNDVEYQEPPSFLDADVPERVDPMFQVDDIKCEYHPSSGIAPEVHAFNEFKHHPTPLASSVPPSKCPWAPFKSRLEFEIADVGDAQAAAPYGTISPLPDEVMPTFHRPLRTITRGCGIHASHRIATYRPSISCPYLSVPTGAFLSLITGS